MHLETRRYSRFAQKPSARPDYGAGKDRNLAYFNPVGCQRQLGAWLLDFVGVREVEVPRYWG